MADYSVTLDRTGSTSLGTALYNPGSGMKRGRIFEFCWGYEGTPADAAAKLEIQRSTTAPTTTGVTPQALDPADQAAVLLAGSPNTVDGTKTAGAFAYKTAMNQRTTFRWVAREGKEIVIPATANNGVHFETPTGPTVAMTLMVHYSE